MLMLAKQFRRANFELHASIYLTAAATDLMRHVVGLIFYRLDHRAGEDETHVCLLFIINTLVLLL